MAEPIDRLQGLDVQIQNEQTKERGRIIGTVVIGNIDPHTISKAQISEHPNLLYHGSPNEFTYSHTGNFDEIKSPSLSNDYGRGFYTTDDRSQAENYSRERSVIALHTPTVYEVIPYKARMLDVRDIKDPEKNGSLPAEFVDEWLKYLGEFGRDIGTLGTLSEGFQKLSKLKAKIYHDNILNNLNRVLEARSGGQEIKIRTDNEFPGIFDKDLNSLLGIIFQKFMTDIGYDGMIYREGGEGKNRKNLTGYVFYNYQAVDTYDGWQKRK